MLDPNALLPERPRRLKRAEYDHLVRLGAFEDERVELLRGVVVSMSPCYPQHAGPITRLTMLLVPPLVGRALVRVQLSLIATDESEPEPDITIVGLDSPHLAHPERAYLVIEVALSSLRKDRLVKAPLYAESGFPEYWLVNVDEQTVEVYRSPHASGYGQMHTVGLEGSLAPLAFPDVELRVRDIFS
jgi:Uma2 family endonuclease